MFGLLYKTHFKFPPYNYTYVFPPPFQHHISLADDISISVFDGSNWFLCASFKLSHHFKKVMAVVLPIILFYLLDVFLMHVPLLPLHCGFNLLLQLSVSYALLIISTSFYHIDAFCLLFLHFSSISAFITGTILQLLKPTISSVTVFVVSLKRVQASSRETSSSCSSGLNLLPISTLAPCYLAIFQHQISEVESAY